MKKHPVIGIISARHKTSAVLPVYYTTSHYLEQVETLGGTPLQIPVLPGSRPEDLETYVNLCDGFLLPGGPDFDCIWYGEELLPNLKEGSNILDMESQKTALDLVRMIVNSGKPTLGICLGEQVLNIALGGSLFQDIPTQIKTELTHSMPIETVESRWKIAHTVRTAEGSLIRRLSGKETIEVNSFHHQAIKQLGKDLTATAWAPDGIVEAVEHKNGKVLAVQWHPENLSHAGIPAAQALFQWLMDTASEK